MKKSILATVCLFALVGCSSNGQYSGNVYSANQANRVQQVSYGTIESVRMVKINATNPQSTSNGLATLSGGVLGGVLGNAIGDGSGRTIATVAGAIAGGMAGSSLENQSNLIDGLQLEIKLKNGDSIIVVQAGSIDEFYLGQRVRLIQDGSNIRVSP